MSSPLCPQQLLNREPELVCSVLDPVKIAPAPIEIIDLFAERFSLFPCPSRLRQRAEDAVKRFLSPLFGHAPGEECAGPSSSFAPEYGIDHSIRQSRVGLARSSQRPHQNSVLLGGVLLEL